MQKLQDKKLQPIDLSRLSNTPLVSVLVANYNYARYISETLESVLRQTYPHFEVVVCDDGSTDNSCNLIASYVRKDSRIKLVCKQNGGVGSALNAAYQESKGEIICLLDADDVWLDNKLQMILEIFKSDPKCGFAIHNVMQIDSQGNPIKSSPMYKHLASGWMAISALENGGMVDNIPPASALSLRREVADYIFPLNEMFVRNADSLIFRCAPFITAIGSVPEVLSLFRIHGANTTTQQGVTVELIEREHWTLERVHQEQKRFLQNVYGAEYVQKLTDWQLSLSARHSFYLLARLKGASKSESRKAHRQMITHPQFKTQFSHSFAQSWLLQWGEYLPNALFKALFEQVYGSSKLKQVVRETFKRKQLFEMS
jgi:glycosyltransferase involved in cell wall biosynthesis